MADDEADNADIEEAKRLMRVVDGRLKRTGQLIGTAAHFAEYHPSKLQTLHEIVNALEEWSDGTLTIVRQINVLTAAVAAGETLHAPKGGA